VNLLHRLALAVATVLVVLAGVGFGLRGQWSAQRAEVVHAGSTATFEAIVDPAVHARWSPWVPDDRVADAEVLNPTAGVGGALRWPGSGTASAADGLAGTLEITEVVPGRKVVARVERGGEVWTSTWLLHPMSHGTEVTWIIRGDAGLRPFKRLATLWHDRTIGMGLEVGLTALRAECE